MLAPLYIIYKAEAISSGSGQYTREDNIGDFRGGQ